MADYGMRGEAAGRLQKKKGKGAPPEDDLGLPPEEGMDDAPPGEGAPPDLAALLGAGGGAPPPGGMPMDEGMPPEGMPGEEMPPEEGGAQDLDTALGSVENALEGLPPEAGEEIRIHLNAIREIAAKAGATGGAMPGQEAAAPEPVGAPPLPGSPAPEEPAL